MENNYNFFEELEGAYKRQEEVAFFMPDNEQALEDFRRFLEAHCFKEIKATEHSRKNHKNRKYMTKGLKETATYYSSFSSIRIIIGYTKKYESHQQVIAFVK